MCNLTQPVQQQKQKSSKPHTLYIIGNGFDLYHNLPTSYVNFRDYILNSEEYKQDAWLMYSIFNFTDNVKSWNNFEEILGNIDIERIIEILIDKSMINADEPHIYNHLNELQTKIQEMFESWVDNIRRKEFQIQQKLMLPKDAVYLTFNYTNILESVYNIPNLNVYYIHGKATKSDDELNPKPIFGHSKKNNFTEKNDNLMEIIDKYMEYRDIEESKRATIRSGICGLWDSFAKKIQIRETNGETIISEEELNDNDYIMSKISELQQKDDNKTYFCSATRYTDYDLSLYEELTDIYVLGHSLGEVDGEYFRAIHEKASNAFWHVSRYDESDEEMKKRLSTILRNKNIEEVETIHMEDISTIKSTNIEFKVEPTLERGDTRYYIIKVNKQITEEILYMNYTEQAAQKKVKELNEYEQSLKDVINKFFPNISKYKICDYVEMLRKDIELIKKEHPIPFDINCITKYQLNDCGRKIIVNNMGYLVGDEKILSSFDYNKIPKQL